MSSAAIFLWRFKGLNFMLYIFDVVGKGLSGELSYMRTGLVRGLVSRDANRKSQKVLSFEKNGIKI